MSSTSRSPQIILSEEQRKAVLDAQGAAVECRSASGERLGFATFVPEGGDAGWSADELAAAQRRARRLGREYSADELLALRKLLQRPWSDEDLRQLQQSHAPAARRLTTAEVLARLATLEDE